jgi:SNF2 family DNA or RNA helicase
MQYSSQEKILIFSKSPLTLALINEGLELLKVQHLEFTSRIEATKREDMARTFETNDQIRVLLMELKLGARGL